MRINILYSSKGDGILAGRNLVPMTDNESDLGSPTKRWKDVYVTNIVGTIIGNSDTATALEVPRSIS